MLRPLNPSLSFASYGKNIEDELRNILKEFGIPLMKIVFISDNGANILLALRILGVVHFSCFAHDLNLAVAKDGLQKCPEVLALIEKSKDIVKHFRFKKYAFAKKQKELMEETKNKREAEQKELIEREFSQLEKTGERNQRM